MKRCVCCYGRSFLIKLDELPQDLLHGAKPMK